jgi:hypothetical protein
VLQQTIGNKRVQTGIRGITCLAMMLAGVPAGPALADEYIETVRVTCIPEIPLLQIEYVAINDSSDFLDRAGRGSTARAPQWQKLRKYGYLPARRFDMTCKLPGTTYRIWGNQPDRQPRGECGGDPRASVSVSRADKVIIDKVYLEPSCLTTSTGHLNPIVIYGGVEEYSENVSATLHDNSGKTEVLWQVGRQLRQDLLDCIVTRPKDDPYLLGAYKKLKTCP